MIVVVGGIKGGSGKTTLATNLAVMRSSQGYKVLLVDADEQKSASDWSEQREGLGIKTDWTTIQLAGKAVNLQLQKMGADYDDVIVDVGGRDTTSQRSALTIADVFLVPFKPRSLDIWTIGAVKAMISEIKIVNPQLQCITVINQADSRGSDNTEALEVLKECPELICCEHSIGYRKVFGNAAADGMGVCELLPLDSKAVHEMKLLYYSVYNPCLLSN